MVRTGDNVIAEVPSTSGLMWKRGRVTEAFNVDGKWEYNVLLHHSFGKHTVRVAEDYVRKIAPGK